MELFQRQAEKQSQPWFKFIQLDSLAGRNQKRLHICGETFASKNNEAGNRPGINVLNGGWNLFFR